MNIQKLNGAIEALKNNLGDGLVSCDIWKTGTGQSIAAYQGGNAKATALFEQITSSIQRALQMASYAPLDEYYLMRLQGGILVIIVIVDEFQWGIAVDQTKAQLGLVLNIALPEAIKELKDAINS